MKTKFQYLFFLILLISLGCRTRPVLDQEYQPNSTDSNEKSFRLSENRDINYNTGVHREIPRKHTPIKVVEMEIPTFESMPFPTTNEGWSSITEAPPASIIREIKERRWGPIYFAYNQSHIGQTEREKVEILSDYLLQEEKYVVIIEGHCDERGSDEYNRSLGEQRAIAVQDYLISLGIDASRMQTISYGEERPLGESHQKNRRAEFIIALPNTYTPPL